MTRKIRPTRKLTPGRPRRIEFEASTLRLLRQLQEVADKEDHLEKFLEETARLLGQAFRHDRVTLFLFDQQSQDLLFLGGWKEDDGFLPVGYRQKISLGLMGKAITKRQPLVVNDVSKEKDFLPVPKIKVGSEACFPIIFKNQILGLLDLIDREKGAFEKDEVDFLNFLSRFLGSALAERQKARALTTQSEKTTLILDGMRDGYYEVNLKGRFTFVNQALARSWGRSREEMLGKSYRDFLEADSIDRVFAIFNEVFRTGKARLGVQAQVRDVRGARHIIEFSVSLLKDEDGRPSGFYGIIHDVTDRVRIEQELREANARFESLLEALPDIIYFKEPAGRNLIVNRAMEELTGLKKDELTGKTDEEVFPPELAAQCRESDRAVLEGQQPLRFHETLVDEHGRKRFFETIKAPVFDQSGKLTGIVGISRNITMMKEAEIKLAAQKALLQTVLDSAEDIIFIMDKDYRFLLFNQAAERYFGLSPAEVVGKCLDEVYPLESWPQAKEGFDRVLRGEIVREDVHLDFRGKKMILSVTEVPLRNEAGEIYGLCGIAREVSQRVELEKALESSLKEKEALLREIHHRVKNNMQIISSLLNLQAYHLQNPELTAILKDCQNRIRSMAIIHEHLYKSTNLARINFADYLNRLVVHLYNAHHQSQEKVQLETELEPVELDIGTAIPLGLLASELISNSFKHAFPGERSGRVRIIFKALVPSGFKLEISDDGVGLPENFTFDSGRTFGMQLVDLLKDQIGARLEVDRTSGARFVITAP